jgi:hypothetical protein
MHENDIQHADEKRIEVSAQRAWIFSDPSRFDTYLSRVITSIGTLLTVLAKFDVVYRKYRSLSDLLQ